MTKVPTTLEMDGLFEEQHIKDRHFFMAVCVNCAKWTKQDSRDKHRTPCLYCGTVKIDNQSNRWYSIRTWDTKKKIQKRDLDAQRGRFTRP